MIKYEKNKLEQIVNESYLYRDVLFKFGRNDSGAAYKTLHRRLKEWNIDTSHFLGKSELMKLKIKDGKYPKTTNENLFTVNNATRHIVKRRIIAENLIEYKCKFCGNNGFWNGVKISLILDHINGVNNDNHLENLRFLCPNCNATLETHCRGSKGLLPKIKKIRKLRKYSSRLNQRKVKDRPSLDELNEMLKTMSYCAIGRNYGVSDNAVRRWMNLYHKINITDKIN